MSYMNMTDETQNYDVQDIQNSKALSFLSYLGILFLIPMLVNKDSAYTKFHVNQGIVLFLTELAGGIAVGIVSFILAFIPVVGAIIGGLLYVVFSIGILILVILGIINAVQGKVVRLPLIGSFQIYK